MPQVETVRPVRNTRLKAVLIVVAGFVVVVAVGGYLYWRLVPSAASTVAQADAANETGNYGQSYDQLKSAYNRAIFPSDKALILSRLAAASEQRGNSAEAMADYQQLDRLKPHDLPTLLSMGDLADRIGQNGVMVSAYSQAIVLMKQQTKGPGTQAAIDALTSKVAEAQK